MAVSVAAASSAMFSAGASAVGGLAGVSPGIQIGVATRRKRPQGQADASRVPAPPSRSAGPKKIYRRHGRINKPGGGRVTSRAAVRTRAATSTSSAGRPSGGGKTLGPRGTRRMTMLMSRGATKI